MEDGINGEIIYFVTTVLEFLLQEFETGVHVKARFGVTKIRPIYRQHWLTWCGLRVTNREHIIADFQRYVRTRREGRRCGGSSRRGSSFEPEALVDPLDVGSESDSSSPRREIGFPA